MDIIVESCIVDGFGDYVKAGVFTGVFTITMNHGDGGTHHNTVVCFMWFWIAFRNSGHLTAQRTQKNNILNALSSCQ